jgi:hypothetical protein
LRGDGQAVRAARAAITGARHICARVVGFKGREAGATTATCAQAAAGAKRGTNRARTSNGSSSDATTGDTRTDETDVGRAGSGGGSKAAHTGRAATTAETEGGPGSGATRQSANRGDAHLITRLTAIKSSYRGDRDRRGAAARLRDVVVWISAAGRAARRASDTCRERCPRDASASTSANAGAD